MNHTISIIIPCKARLAHLMQCLVTVLDQTYKDLQIIVVDFNCPENTSEVIADFFDDPRIEIYKENVPEDHWSLSEARNAGYKYAKGNTILFIDADTLLKPTFLEMAIKNLSEGKQFVTGLIQPPWNGCGCMLACKEDFKKARGYNEAFTAWGYDDIDMYKRLESAGLLRMTFDPELIENINHDDNIRNTFHGDQDKMKTLEVNFQLSQKGVFQSSL